MSVSVFASWVCAQCGQLATGWHTCPGASHVHEWQPAGFVPGYELEHGLYVKPVIYALCRCGATAVFEVGDE